MPRIIGTELLNRLHEKYRTPYNNADPQLEVIISRPRYSVTDTSQFQVDTIREATGLGDLGVDIKREDILLPPTHLYEVHNDNGYIKTATRAMPATPAHEWVDGVTIAAGNLCRIAFNGNWAWYERQQKYRFKTEGDPFIFFTDSSDNLQVQTWESDTDREQLATDVTVSMDCIRSWREPNATSNDQGMIVAYIKSDGKLYYRQYLYGGTAYAWESQQEITLTGVTDSFVKVELFLTPDYRLGFAITTDIDEVYWIITERNWAGLALRPEALEVAFTGYEIERIKITFIDGYETETLEVALTDYTLTRLYGGPLEFIAAENIDNGSGDYGYKIEITLNERVYDVSGNHLDFSVTDEDSNSYPPTAAEIKSGSDNKVIILTCTDFNAAVDDITVSYTLNADTIEGEAGQDLATQSITFTPTGLVPPVIDPPVYSSAENIEGEEL